MASFKVFVLLDLFSEILYSLVTLLVILDPVVSLNPFLAFTAKTSPANQRRAATQVVVLAGFLAVVFLFAGPFLLSVLKISFTDVKIAGGIVLGLLGLQTVLNFSFGKEESGSASVVLIATPLLTGPGLFTTVILLSGQYGYLVCLIALALALFACWILFYYATKLQSLVGDKAIDIASRVLGLLVVALAVSFIRSGLTGGA